MTIRKPESQPTYGYLLVTEDDLHGYTGGLLIVCERGRPLEFHCTEPVRPNRAQQILFGPTLRSYLCGEQLGGALLSKAHLPISLLLVEDQDAALAGELAGIETVLLAHEDEQPERLATLREAIDPAEPFGRVREAIREAQRLSAAEEHRAAA